ncbi:TetR/AcrR family transcriptional regulator [Acaryochloris marina]|uniref:TetR/AcrR family transcriptional regulator n=1 Tax=Acaryochloris marina TaxID=155978 RepID=UPI001BAEEF2D|nr:TetR/AcrR family transcriptional regulator [Acaryochloris marina]
MGNTRTKILDVAERLTQTKGFNGFSYLDLADEIGIKNSSIHYHFKAKADLALALVERLHEGHSAVFEDLNKNLDTPQQRLQAVVDYFQTYIQDEKFCMCGMMAAELQSVSPAVRSRLIAYFKDLQIWLTEQFAAMGEPDAQNKALRFVSTAEGSLLLARLENDPKIVGQALKTFIHG